MTDLLGYKDLSRLMSLLVSSRSEAQGFSSDWAVNPALSRGLCTWDMPALASEEALYREILDSGLFFPAKDILDTKESCGYLNLSKFGPETFFTCSSSVVEHQVVEVCQKVKWLELQHVIETAVHFLDSVCTHPRRHLSLGSFGLAELLIRLGIPYGNNDLCRLFLDELFFSISHWAYRTSIHLARERGEFSDCNRNISSETLFVDRLDLGLASRGSMASTLLRNDIANWGIRNEVLVQHSSVGSPGFTAGTSSGSDPFPSFLWAHKGVSGECVEAANVARDYSDQFGVNLSSPNCLPLYFLTASEVDRSSSDQVHRSVQFWSDRPLQGQTVDLDNPDVEISSWIPTDPPVESKTVDPASIHQISKDLKITNWDVTVDSTSGMFKLDLSLEISQTAIERKRTDDKLTIPAVLPPSYNYDAQRSTIPAAPMKKKL
jgi:hypothetical protein